MNSDNDILYSNLIKILGEDNVKKSEPMKNHTTFRIGGDADLFATPVNAEQIHDTVIYLKKAEVPYYVVGNGSNLLVSDAGYRGVIIQLYSRFAGYEILHDNCESAVDKADVIYIRVQSGMSIIKLASIVAGYSLSGMEFASGIPGSIGGGIMMNAGAYGGEMKDVLKWVKVLDNNGEMKTLKAEELELGYRTSIIVKEKMIVLEACIELHEGNRDEIEMHMKELMAKRKEKQPLEYPSAGSTFKRPEGYFAGKLIQDAGLKGYQVGDAQVSEKHSGFVINYDNATATDIINLMKNVRKKVYEEFQVTLEPEVKILPAVKW